MQCRGGAEVQKHWFGGFTEPSSDYQTGDHRGSTATAGRAAGGGGGSVV